MSKRFGRNQRRRMRNELRNAQEGLVMSQSLLRRAATQRDDLARAMDEARYVLGDHIALPPRLQSRHPNPLGRDWDALRSPRLSMADFMGDADVQPIAQKIERMHILLQRSREFEDMGLHVRTTLDSGEVVYNISHSALYSVPKDYLEQLLVREISRQSAQLLADVLRKKEAA